MDYSKFYTPPEIADLLVRQLKLPAPLEIVDICCGSCNLLHAGRKRWPKAKLTGVDVIAQPCADVTFVKSDGRKFALEHLGQYPLVLANPPFDFVKSKREFPQLFEALPRNCNTSRLEVEMLLANLQLLKENGILLIIVPSTFVTAERYRNIRIFLSQNYHIQKIIHLPDDTFGSTHISSCALVIKNEKSFRRYTNQFTVAHEKDRYTISQATSISQEMIRSGNWNGHFPSCSKNFFYFRRGNISSQYFVDKGIAILHTAKTSEPWKPTIRYISTPHPNAVYAEPGDIVISRIGKSAGKWFRYGGPRILISDCLYVLRDTDGCIFRKIAGKQYPYSPKGVAVKYITMSDFSSWINTL